MTGYGRRHSRAHATPSLTNHLKRGLFMNPRLLLGGSAATLLAAFLIGGCGGNNSDFKIARDMITAEDLGAHISILASDDFEGRGPSSRGEERTIHYLREHFVSLGLEPGNGESYFQEVPLVEMTVAPTALLIESDGPEQSLVYGEQFVAWTKRVVKGVSLRSSELVFVGYGIVAPEYEWNDYAGLDVNDKTVVMLVNDPGFATQDETLFTGNAMTYYGRWTYKFEEAARQGAAGAIVVHEENAAGYPWEVVTNSWTGPQFDLVAADSNLSRCAVESWVTQSAAASIFSAAGFDFQRLSTEATSRSFVPVLLNSTASITLKNTLSKSVSNNVLALLRGRSQSDEVVVYMAHWDHLGINPMGDGDQVFNGAVDNASGTASLLELAEAFAGLKERPARNILFLATTAEEQGLLGSLHYVRHPVYPLAKTVAALNMDSMNILGRMKDITVVGHGMSELDDYIQQAAATQRRQVRPDPYPEKGFYYRSDHFSFARAGVPALYADPGTDHVEHGVKWTSQQADDYRINRYHKPADEYDPEWDLSGMVEDVQLLFAVGYRLSIESTYPNWREGTEFKATRDEDLKSLNAMSEGQ